jgi:purine-binding chemotaxis protein CheW
MVREVLDLLPETPVPGAPAFVGAVINFRGRVIPLVDLRLAFDMESASPRSTTASWSSSTRWTASRP